ncbi:hypothetical protein IKE82_00115 [Candidatus Saccharibacteria bacterium]|nr:hypothetical protein [Candidatus Saccharibacteria bacterium]
MKLKYSVTIGLKQFSNKSFELLTTLGFTIFIQDEVTNQVIVIDDYRKTTKIVSIDTLKNPSTRYKCIYNGERLPSECLTALLEDDPNVSSYTIEKRDS